MQKAKDRHVLQNQCVVRTGRPPVKTHRPDEVWNGVHLYALEVLIQIYHLDKVKPGMF